MEHSNFWQGTGLAPLNIIWSSAHDPHFGVPASRSFLRNHDFQKLEDGLKQDIAGNLIVVRMKRRITQTRMASLMGVSRAQWRKYESGAEMLRIDAAIYWCLLTGVSISRLFYGTAYEACLHPALRQPSLDGISHLVCQLDDSTFIELTTSLCRSFGLSMAPLRLLRPAQNISMDAVKEELATSLLPRIGQGLKHFRLRLDITQEQMAEMLNISLSSYQQYEKAQAVTRFSVACAARFLHATRLDPLILIEGSLTAQRLRSFNARIGLYNLLIKQLPTERRPDFCSQVLRSQN